MATPGAPRTIAVVSTGKMFLHQVCDFMANHVHIYHDLTKWLFKDPAHRVGHHADSQYASTICCVYSQEQFDNLVNSVVDSLELHADVTMVVSSCQSGFHRADTMCATVEEVLNSVVDFEGQKAFNCLHFKVQTCNGPADVDDMLKNAAEFVQRPWMSKTPCQDRTKSWAYLAVQRDARSWQTWTNIWDRRDELMEGIRNQEEESASSESEESRASEATSVQEVRKKGARKEKRKVEKKVGEVLHTKAKGHEKKEKGRRSREIGRVPKQPSHPPPRSLQRVILKSVEKEEVHPKQLSQKERRSEKASTHKHQAQKEACDQQGHSQKEGSQKKVVEKDAGPKKTCATVGGKTQQGLDEDTSGSEEVHPKQLLQPNTANAKEEVPSWCTFRQDASVWKGVLDMWHVDTLAQQTLFLLAQHSGEGFRAANCIVSKLFHKFGTNQELINPSAFVHKAACNARISIQ